MPEKLLRVLNKIDQSLSSQTSQTQEMIILHEEVESSGSKTMGMRKILWRIFVQKGRKRIVKIEVRKPGASRPFVFYHSRSHIEIENNQKRMERDK